MWPVACSFDGYHTIEPGNDGDGWTVGQLLQNKRRPCSLNKLQTSLKKFSKWLINYKYRQ